MKKRGLMILAMLLICSILIFLSKGLQSSTLEKLASGSKENDQIQISNTESKVFEETVSEDQTKGDTTPDEEKNNNEADKSTVGKESTVANTPKADNKQESKGSSAEAAENKETKSPSKAKPSQPVSSTPNLVIVDTVSGKTIYSVKIAYDSKKTLYEYTNEALTKAKIKKFIKSNGYVAMIDNLFDYPSMPDKKGKSDWSSCGWIYYINGTKAVVGAKDYIPKEKDVITWKYWKDAIYEK